MLLQDVVGVLLSTMTVRELPDCFFEARLMSDSKRRMRINSQTYLIWDYSDQSEGLLRVLFLFSALNEFDQLVCDR